MRINFTICNRLHLIWNADVRYVTVRLFGRRLHWCNKAFGPSVFWSAE